MSTVTIVLAVLVMLVGLVGTVVPMLPGLPIVWAAALVAWLVAGFTTAAWITMALLTTLLAIGSLTKYALPTRSGSRAGVPRTSMVVAVLAAVVGFFAIPVLGFLIGGAAGLYVAEHRRLGSGDEAWESTRAVLRGYGVGVVVEVATGLVMVVVFVIGALAVG